MRLALAQINPTVGDLTANARLIEGYARRAGDARADVVCFPELALTGYPPRDLLTHEGFVEDAARALRSLALATADLRDLHIVVGCPWRPPPGSGATPADAFDDAAPTTNSLLVIHGGRITHRADKRLLPTYDVFDEDRYFKPGSRATVMDVGGVRVGLSICEDLWRAVDVGAEGSHRYADRPDPMAELVEAGATVILNPSASPFVLGKGDRQRTIVRTHVAKYGVTIATVNQVGGNDDLIFDGHSAVVAPGPGGARAPALIAAAPGFVEHLLVIDLASKGALVADPLMSADQMSLLYRALVLGIRDYARKTGFREVVLGVSGGIDSALTAALAVAAMGAKHVTGIALPSRYSSEHSVDDAHAVCRALGCRCIDMPIEQAHAAMEGMLAPVYEAMRLDPTPGVTEENIQSRIRGTMMMAMSNKTGALLLTTGNKSELAVGYCTLYGDMNGGLAVLSDLTKNDVYRLSRWINANCAAAGFDGPPIPEGSLTKPPSAELRPNQTDQDTLPAYDVLDEIVERYVERRQSPARITRETGFAGDVVSRITRMIDLAEYKRKQMPIGLKVTGIAFGRGRRMPLAQGYRPTAQE